MLVSTLIPADVRFAQRYSPHKWYPSSLQTATIGCLPRVFVHIIISIIVDTRSFHLLIFDHNDNSQMNSQSRHNRHYQSELDASNFFLSFPSLFIYSISLSFALSLGQHFCVLNFLSFCLCFSLSVCLPSFLSLYQPVCLYLCLSANLFNCLFSSLSICLYSFLSFIT